MFYLKRIQELENDNDRLKGSVLELQDKHDKFVDEFYDFVETLGYEGVEEDFIDKGFELVGGIWKDKKVVSSRTVFKKIKKSKKNK